MTMAKNIVTDMTIITSMGMTTAMHMDMSTITNTATRRAAKR